MPDHQDSRDATVANPQLPFPSTSPPLWPLPPPRERDGQAPLLVLVPQTSSGWAPCEPFTIKPTHLSGHLGVGENLATQLKD